MSNIIKQLYAYPLRKLFTVYLIARLIDSVTAYLVFLHDPARFIRVEVNKAFISLLTQGNWYPQVSLEIAFLIFYVLGLVLFKRGLKNYLEKEDLDSFLVFGLGIAISFTLLIWFTMIGIVSNLMMLLIMFLGGS